MKKLMTSQQVLAKRSEYLAPTAKHWYSNPPHFVSGSMQFLFDETGKEYLDLFAGICTVSVGHSNPKVTERVVQQAQTLQHTSTVFLSQGIVELAERLARITPGRLQKSFLTNSGTEANEAAILMAKNHTGRTEIIALRHAYHGRSYLAGSLTAQSSYRVDLTPVPGISFAPNPYCYRCPFGKEPGSCAMECAKAVEDVIQTQTSGAPAVMIAEPIQGVGGIITPPKDYFPEVKRILEKYGVLFISDEVQTGFGRTGGKWFGIEHWGVEPDLMTMAKGIANGYPAGAAIARAEVADSLQRGTINTFGGNPISSEAALATIDYLEEHRLMDNAKEVGGYFKDRLMELAETYPIVGEVRGMGLMLGVELVKDKQTKEPAPDFANRVLDLTQEAGIVIGKGGIHGNTLRLQ
ncbi:MAG TPA: aspartate aminotransferase family protein, partial [Stenomitos sp.]